MVHSKNKSGIKHLFHGAIWCFFLILLTVKPIAQHGVIDAYRIVQNGGDTTIVCSLPVYKPSINQINSSPNNSTVINRVNKGKSK
jgi:hypothetical protein